MKNVVLFFAVSLLAACGGQLKSSNAKLTDSQVEPIEFSGEDGQKVFKALQDMGVVDTDRLIGAMNLEVESLRCSQLIYVPAGGDTQPSCQFIRKKNDGSHEIATVNGQAPIVMLDVLSQHGAAVNGGINGRAIAAQKLHCSLAVYPNAMPHCVIEL